MTSITVTLPWPPAECSPNSRAHWRKRAEVSRLSKEWAYWSSVDWLDGQFLGFEDAIKVSYWLNPPDHRRRDLDNFVARCKPFLDGICERLGIDDSQIKQTSAQWGDKHPGGQVIITLEVME